MSHLFLDVTANFLPGHSRSRSFFKNWEGGFLVSTLRLSDSDFEGKLWIAKIRFSKLISKSISPIPIESHFDTQKFEFSVPNYPKILIFVSKFKFFFHQNLDFVLGRQRRNQRVIAYPSKLTIAQWASGDLALQNSYSFSNQLIIFEGLEFFRLKLIA